MLEITQRSYMEFGSEPRFLSELYQSEGRFLRWRAEDCEESVFLNVAHLHSATLPDHVKQRLGLLGAATVSRHGLSSLVR